eukprot:1159338-Pelagomonas_calceolata.AAC.1
MQNSFARLPCEPPCFPAPSTTLEAATTVGFAHSLALAHPHSVSLTCFCDRQGSLIYCLLLTQLLELAPARVAHAVMCAVDCLQPPWVQYRFGPEAQPAVQYQRGPGELERGGAAPASLLAGIVMRRLSSLPSDRGPTGGQAFVGMMLEC